jgi:S-DNA-T family DNA segregation ATPase FtsK/SpoIIIE
VSKPLGAHELPARLAELRDAIRDADARLGQFESESRQRAEKERRAADAEAKKLDAALADALAQAEAEAQAGRVRLVETERRRAARIADAAHNVLTRGLAEIEQDEGKRTYKVQYGLLQANRTRDAERAASEQWFAEFQATLAQEEAALVALEQRADGVYRGYRSLLRSGRAASGSAPAANTDEEKQISTLRETMAQVESALRHAGGGVFLLLFRLFPLPLLVVLMALGVGGYAAWLHFGQSVPIPVERLAIWGGGLVVAACALYFLGRAQVTPDARRVGGLLARARQLHVAAGEAAAHTFQRRMEQTEATFTARTNELNDQWSVLLDEPGRQRADVTARVEQKQARVLHRHERQRQARHERFEREAAAHLAEIKATFAARRGQITGGSGDRAGQLATERQSSAVALEAEVVGRVASPYQTLASANHGATELFPPWSSFSVSDWRQSVTFPDLLRVGEISVDLAALTGVALEGGAVKLPGPSKLTVPACLTFPHHGSVLFETSKHGREQAIASLNNLVLRLLATAPPGRLNFSLIDPVGLGQSFAGITHLSDFGEHLINGRIWTQSTQIDQRLAELNEHMEKVIQMYLRNEYATIADYNAKAGTIAEKYQFLVIADFPVNFGETAIKRLLSIASSGARCGVFTLIHWDRRHALPADLPVEDLRKAGVVFVNANGSFTLPGQPAVGTRLTLDAPPDAATVTQFIQKVGQESISASRVEVPFAQIAPPPEQRWSLDTTSELRVPIGRTGATKLQYLAIGQGTRQHALIAGKTGSGKSTLFHVIITNLALWCRPDQVEFYLVDFKKGVEFQCYAEHQLPHARVVAIESDREFGLSVLQRLDDELRRRGELFRGVGAQDLAGYKRAGGKEAIPRTLLVIDEFQEFFTEDDRISQGAALLLDRIVRQGRAFGIHVLLGSQTLGGAYTLARTTIGQMVIRIALQCNEADAYLIMDENNPAPRLLSRPGEGIYNDQAGMIEGNSPFQTVWLSDADRDRELEIVAEQARRSGATTPAPIVFAGNAPADVRENRLLAAATQSRPTQAPDTTRCWLGAPNSIKGPTEALFRRQSGNNLLVVGQREEAALALVSIAVVGLAAQFPAGAVRVIVLDASAPSSPERERFDQLASLLPGVLTLAHGSDAEAAVNALAGELKARLEDGGKTPAPTTFLFIHGLHRFKKLRHEDDFGFGGADAAPNPGQQLGELISEGPAHGIHVVAVTDTYNNVNRFLSRKALGEFELRVLFQMSANDSAALCESPRAANLGLHRAVFYNEQEGYLEVFRPYALPAGEWVKEAAIPK